MKNGTKLIFYCLIFLLVNPIFWFWTLLDNFPFRLRRVDGERKAYLLLCLTDNRFTTWFCSLVQNFPCYQQFGLWMLNLSNYPVYRFFFNADCVLLKMTPVCWSTRGCFHTQSAHSISDNQHAKTLLGILMLGQIKDFTIAYGN